tara:strand:- start:142 stop:750 length:609 start_codon:yes stop_codon:yes gene_type:complete
MEAYSTIHHSAEGISDVEIWQRLKKSDNQALKLIYNQHIKVLYLYGGKFSKNREVIEDCIQELFMTLWERRFIIGDTDAIRPYLLTSLRRRMIRVTSKNHIRIDRNFEIEKYDFNIEFSSEEQLINDEDSTELINKLSTELNKLTKKQQEVIYLKYHCGLGYEEIADVMAINYQSARNLMHKSLLLLRKQFSQLLIFSSILI